MFDKVSNILKEFINDDRINITPDSTLVEDLGLTSLDVVNLIVTFEDEFDVEIPERLIPSIHTVQDIVNFFEKTSK